MGATGVWFVAPVPENGTTPNANVPEKLGCCSSLPGTSRKIPGGIAGAAVGMGGALQKGR